MVWLGIQHEKIHNRTRIFDQFSDLRLMKIRELIAKFAYYVYLSCVVCQVKPLNHASSTTVELPFSNTQTMIIRDEVPSLNKFWRYLVHVKIVKIKHLIGHISYENQNKKKYFFVKRNTIMLLHMYWILSSLLGRLHLFVHFFFPFMEYLFLDTRY